MSVKLLIDSTVDIAEDYKEYFSVVPMTLSFGDEEFIDGVTINREEFYQKLVESDVIPTTSQASPALFEEYYAKLTKNGDSVVVITLSSKLSGTYQSACIAAEEYENVYVVDSLNATTGSGILAEYAVTCMKSGMEAKDIYNKLLKKRDDVCLVALLDTLEYLKKGGRISKTAAFAGGLLNIKPVVTVKDGEISVIGKARGSKQGNNLLVEKINEAGGIDFNMPVLLGYSGLTRALLDKYIEDSRPIWENNTDKLDSTLVCSVIGTHVGPGCIVATFFKNN